MKTRLACWLALAVLTATAAAAQLVPGRPLPVRILYDNSGSMYPGYQPPGAPDRRNREQLGVHYVHASPEFAQWLDDFVRRQNAVDGSTAGMWTFTSDQQFTPDDIQQVHPAVPLHDFSAANAIAHFPVHRGLNTYLTETLETFTRDYTGLIWLITDNIVETTAGEPDAGVQRFFETLAHRNEIRSVHLFKYPVSEAGQTATLAIYGLVVSPSDVPVSTLAYYDTRFRTLRELFPGSEYLKLKNLSVEPITVSADLQLVLADRDKGMFREGQSVQLALEGELRSNLTQHSVTAGQYELAIAAPFVAEDWARQKLGAQALPPQAFDSATGEIRTEIPPNGTQRVKAVLHSTQPVSFRPSNPLEWLRLAWNGATVRYTGAVRMSFRDVNVRLERQRMAGIFGIDHASTIFSFQDVTKLPEVRPSVVPVTFALRTGTSRTAVLLVVLALLAAIIGVTGFVLTRKQPFRIAISNAPDTVTALRRFGSHNVIVDGKLLGRLSRGLGSSYAFLPIGGSREFTVVPASEPGTWDVKLTSGGSRRLTIKPEGGGRAKARAPSAAPARAAPPPRAPSAPKSAPPIPGRPPRIGRP